MSATESARRVVNSSVVDSASALRYADDNIAPDVLASEFADVIDLRPAGVSVDRCVDLYLTQRATRPSRVAALAADGLETEHILPIVARVEGDEALLDGLSAQERLSYNQARDAGYTIVRRLVDDLGAEASGDRAFRIARSFTDNERARQALIRYANDTDGVLLNPATPEEYWGSANAVLEMIDDLTLTEPPLGAELVEKFVGQIGQVNRGELDELVQALDEDPIEFLNRLERVSPAGTPLWLIIMEQGRRFNADNNGRYLSQVGAVELYLGRGPNGGPPYYILDSYIPPNPDIGELGQIVSRKNTQLANVQESTAIGYIKEFTTKYSAGCRIASTNSVPTNLRGQTIEGQLFLEVPVQDAPIPQAVLQAATDQGVVIRDVVGRVYN